MTQHLFFAINDLFRSNNKDNIAREEPISLKKLRKGNSTLSTQKVVLGWAIDTVKKLLTLKVDCKTNLLALLKTTPSLFQPMLQETMAQSHRHPT